MMRRTREEYGGFLPLELNRGNEYFGDYEEYLIRFNCAKAAVAHVIEVNAFKKILVPYYLCPNVCGEIEHHGISVEYYFIDRNLLPIGVEDEDGVCIYLVNYFGIMDRMISKYAKVFQKARVIIDNCHSFFNSPVMKENIYNVYSAKKFFGVPDGAYLIAKEKSVSKMIKYYSSEDATYLLESVEYGTNYCYDKKKKADLKIAGNYGHMSFLSRRILEAVDYNAVKARRKNNFRCYQENFASSNILKLEADSVPYMYPLNIGKNIKQELVREKIYVPTLWGSTLKEEFRGKWEYMLSDETIFLPLDQRYDENDIRYIVDTVKEILGGRLYGSKE